MKPLNNLAFNAIRRSIRTYLSQDIMSLKKTQALITDLQREKYDFLPEGHKMQVESACKILNVDINKQTTEEIYNKYKFLS